MKEMVGGCCVCSDESGSPENPLVYCDGDGCNVAVHQACYGIVTVPQGSIPWFCKRCQSQERAARVKCELCPSRHGALKRTDTGSWAHVVCALYIPEVRFGNVTTMEPIMISSLPADRFHKSCYICEESGRESKSTSGACMQCNKSNCKNYFHVTCAQAIGFLCEEAGNLNETVKYCGYCRHHYNKLLNSSDKVMNKGSTTKYVLISSKKDYPNIKPIPAFRCHNDDGDNNDDSSPDSSPDRRRRSNSSSSSNLHHLASSSSQNDKNKQSSSSSLSKKSSPNSPKAKNNSSSSSSLSKIDQDKLDPLSGPRPFESQAPPSGQFSLSSFINPNLANKAQSQSKPDNLSLKDKNNATTPGGKSKDGVSSSCSESIKGKNSKLDEKESSDKGSKKRKGSVTSITTSSKTTMSKGVPAPAKTIKDKSETSSKSSSNMKSSNSISPKSSKSTKNEISNKRRISDTSTSSTEDSDDDEDDIKVKNSDSKKKKSKVTPAASSKSIKNSTSSMNGSKSSKKPILKSSNLSKKKKNDSDSESEDDSNDSDSEITIKKPATKKETTKESSSGRRTSTTDRSNVSKSKQNGFLTSPSPSLTPMTNRNANHGHNVDLDRSTASSSGTSSNVYHIPNAPFRSFKNSNLEVSKDVTEPVATSLEALLERNWAQSANFVMDQATHYDIANLMSVLSAYRNENDRLEERLRNLTARRDHLSTVNARLALPLNGTFANAFGGLMPPTSTSQPMGPSVPGLPPASAALLSTFLTPHAPINSMLNSSSSSRTASEPFTINGQRFPMATSDGSGAMLYPGGANVSPFGLAANLMAGNNNNRSMTPFSSTPFGSSLSSLNSSSSAAANPNPGPQSVLQSPSSSSSQRSDKR